MRYLQKSQNSQKHLLKCMKLVINTKCDLCLFLIKWSENSVRFVKSYGFQMEQGLSSALISSSVKVAQIQRQCLDITLIV